MKVEKIPFFCIDTHIISLNWFYSQFKIYGTYFHTYFQTFRHGYECFIYNIKSSIHISTDYKYAPTYSASKNSESVCMSMKMEEKKLCHWHSLIYKSIWFFFSYMKINFVPKSWSMFNFYFITYMQGKYIEKKMRHKKPHEWVRI